MAENEKKKDEKPSFAAVLAQIRPGTDLELAEGLSSVIEAVRSTGKPGRISAVFEIKPVDGGMTAVTVSDKITVKLPEKNRASSIAYIGADNTLQRTDPSAMPLFDEDIRDVKFDTQTGEVREV